jgi:hypothetical protein
MENQAVLDDAAILARVKEIDPIVREHAAEAGRECGLRVLKKR